LRLSPGCRLHPTEPVLLIPEGTLQLSGPARDILFRLDGQRTIANVIDDLLAEYSGAEREAVERDVLDLLGRIQERGLIRSE
jgi:pyrroloquinoline quinone biosynthesis protein D